MREYEKLLHLLHQKLKTRVFRQLESSKTVMRKATEVQQLSQEALGRETVTRQQRQLMSGFGKIHFQPNSISREAVGHEVVAKQQREFLCDKMKKIISLKPFSREALSRRLFARQPLNQFLEKNTKMHFEQNIRYESIKSLSKTNKTLKNLFGFDQQIFEHTHHI